MKREEEEQESIIENLDKFADEKQAKSNLRQSTENNTNTLTKKREREKEKENDEKKNDVNEKVFIYSDDEDNAKIDDSSSSEEDYFISNDYFDKKYGNEDEKLEHFYDVETNK